MFEKAYFIISLVLIVVCAVTGILFVSVPVPKKKGLDNYHISLKVLCFSFISFSIILAISMIFGLSDNSSSLFSFVGLLISSSQALLFLSTLITLLNPRIITRSYLVKQSSPLLVIIVLYTFSAIFFGDPQVKSIPAFIDALPNPAIIIRILLLLFFVFQLVFYSISFFREKKQFKNEINNYFSETIHLRLNWVTYAFISALLIGVLSLIWTMLPYKAFSIICPVIFIVFYFAFAIKYINYPNIYSVIMPAMDIAKPAGQSFKNDAGKWAYYRDLFIQKETYLVSGITIEEMAQTINLNRNTLSSLINDNEKVNFNRWINYLRIEKAKQIMTNNPSLTLSEIAEETGYSDLPGFSRQFKFVTGKTPSSWRKEA